MKLKHRELRRRAKAVILLLSWLDSQAEHVADRLNTEADDGISGIAYDGSRRAPGHSDPVASRAGRGIDLVAVTIKELQANLEGLERALRAAQRLSNARAKAPESAAKLRKEAGVGDCVNCSHFCAGMVVVDGKKIEDRLRSGRCDPCRTHLRRTGKERPKDRWTETPDGPSDQYWIDLEEAKLSELGTGDNPEALSA